MTVRERIIATYLPLVENIARRIYERLPRNKVLLEDLISVGYYGLLQAVDKLKGESEGSNSLFIEIRIKGAIYDYLRSLDLMGKERRRRYKKVKEAYERLLAEYGEDPNLKEVADLTGLDEEDVRAILLDGSVAELQSLFDSVFSDREDEEVIDRIASEEDLEELVEKEEFLKAVSQAFEELDDREKILLSLYYFEGLPLKKVAELMDISESRASQIHWRAIKKIRNILEKRGYKLEE
ncbi:MAG: sigma-70 family RNA polymerase sigma factor [Thermosulfidibacteraceae bacterium]|jgi:RNA polymerase sigma factor for flagellar operon FliA